MIHKTLFTKFTSKHIKRGFYDCWEWTGCKLPTGYGRLNHKNKSLYAHRVSYELFVAPIPDGMQVLHSCDNPSCVNPEHLFLGTPEDNIKDRHVKGRNACKLYGKRLRTVLKLLKEKKNTQVEIAKQFNTTQPTLSQLKRTFGI